LAQLLFDSTKVDVSQPDRPFRPTQPLVDDVAAPG